MLASARLSCWYNIYLLPVDTACTSSIFRLFLLYIILFSPLGKPAIYFACINLLFFYYEQSYLSIYWTNFHDLFTKWKVFAWIFLIQSSFSDSSRNVAMVTNFVSFQTCSHGAKVSQDPLNRFSQSLHSVVGIELQMIKTFYFFRYLKGRCHGNQFSGKNGTKLPTIPALIALSFRYGMGYRYLNVCVNSINGACKSC